MGKTQEPNWNSEGKRFLYRAGAVMLVGYFVGQPLYRAIKEQFTSKTLWTQRIEAERNEQSNRQVDRS